MTDAESESLNRVLRCEMSAVNRQLIHVLALRDWLLAEAAQDARRLGGFRPNADGPAGRAMAGLGQRGVPPIPPRAHLR